MRDTLIPHTSLERDQLADYFAERERLTNWRIEYPLLLAMLRVRSLPAWPWRQSSVEQDVLNERQGSETIDRDGAQPALDYAYAWSNFLAVRYAQLFRSGHVTNYFLSAFAVILALSGLIVPQVKVYLVFDKAYKGDLQLILRDKNNKEAGRSKISVDEQETGKYMLFPFDPMTEWMGVSATELK